MVRPARGSSEPPIPLEAPVAPMAEAWARMTPAERERAVDDLLSSETQEEIEELDAMAEGDAHLNAKMGIRDTLRSHFGKVGRRIYVGADIKVYYPGQKGFTPDVIAVTDVEPGHRDCWMVSQEGKGVDLAFEVHYRGNWKKDFVTNVTKYAALGIREYFIYDIRHHALRGYRLPPGGAAYDPIAQHGGRLRSTVLDLELALEGDRVCFYVGGAILITGAELVGKLEGMVDAAIARADEQQARADEQQARADAAAVRIGSAILTILTVRGIDVDAEARDRILGCTEVATLAVWLERAPSVARCEALFASTG